MYLYQPVLVKVLHKFSYKNQLWKLHEALQCKMHQEVPLHRDLAVMISACLDTHKSEVTWMSETFTILPFNNQITEKWNTSKARWIFQIITLEWISSHHERKGERNHDAVIGAEKLKDRRKVTLNKRFSLYG